MPWRCITVINKLDFFGTKSTKKCRYTRRSSGRNTSPSMLIPFRGGGENLSKDPLLELFNHQIGNYCLLKTLLDGLSGYGILRDLLFSSTLGNVYHTGFLQRKWNVKIDLIEVEVLNFDQQDFECQNEWKESILCLIRLYNFALRVI